ncbi:MAG: 2-C-methyl-D-erythritol 4-phosphate cytidylyltransferase [Solirubrobacteraceae bacterium]|jgi:2-C-methyl-D-erythritol 4-phosphate cytidylyltransferase|nr:2-C-methyl-D-erythritol 4-phosphate cytidylyltransferase [Solirubrobacteraceae bacterium]
MLEWSLVALREVAAIEQIVVALPPDAEAPDGVVGVAGGEHRSQSVRAALAAGAGDPVIVHDAARPLVTPELIAAALDELAASGCDGVIAAAPVTDTIKQVAEGAVVRTIDRATLWSVQTPQVFRRAALERALDVGDDVLAAATDDAWLVERAGGVVRIVAAPPGNLKITTPADLRVAEAVLAERAGARSR